MVHLIIKDWLDLVVNIRLHNYLLELVQQSSPEVNVSPTQLACPQIKLPLQSLSESQSPSLLPHWLDEVQQSLPPLQD